MESGDLTVVSTTNVSGLENEDLVSDLHIRLVP